MFAKDLTKMKKSDLLDMARSKGLKVTTRMRKAEIIDVIKKGSPRVSETGKKAAAKSSRKTTRRTRPAAGKTGGKRRKSKTSGGSRRKRSAKSVPSAEAAQPEEETIRQRAVSGKYYLGKTEEAAPPLDTTTLPDSYGVTRIAAMVRDPHWIFAYWEVTSESYQKLRDEFGREWPDCRIIIRVYRTDRDPGEHFDITLEGEANNWYIRVSPQGQYRISIGAISSKGEFREVASSNTVETPRASISDEIDEKWMAPDEFYHRVVMASGGYETAHTSSAELGEAVRKHLAGEISSGAVSSFGSGALRGEEGERGFYLRVATELILYGATEPDAKVKVKGEDIELRSDGTFSLRFELPDGDLDLPVTAVSTDGMEERSVDTRVTKTSKQKEPVKK